ncbi:neuronal acetylcholine receptor subunit alpha-7 [Plakobranchus ocellatus]|uniref:Neuronal acetylcholine receptor subunit alpha-7 n=1 Tax=Plakobranchus ocellatus TaxID=259542 RepID=A0AAV3YBK1_9GAST|nr:neuronal acetylcholine receptor subunit alpha-7 [Plakobranchus ocellatus]
MACGKAIYSFLALLLMEGTGAASTGGVEDMSRLVDTLFKGYNPVVSPRPDNQSPVVVKVSLSVAAIIGLDTKEQILKIRGHTKFMILAQRRANLEERVTNGQFYITMEDAVKEILFYGEFFYEQIIFKIQLSRRPTHVALSLLFPLFLSGLLGPLAFLIPPDDAEKVSVSVTVLLATTVFIGVIHDDLPDRSDKTPTVALYVLSLLVLAFLGVLGNTVVLLVQRKGSDVTLVPRREHSAQGSPYNISDSSLDVPASKEPVDKTNQSPDRVKLSYGPYHNLTPNGANFSLRPRSRAENLNWIFFVANITSLLFVTCVVFLYIFI